MKNINKLCFVFVFMITLFSFNMKVDAAKELSCVYENGYKLTQDSSGSLKFFSVVRSTTGSYWDEYTETMNGKKVEIEVESVSLNSCPSFLTVDNNIIKFDEKNNFFTVDYEMLNQRESIADDFKELTCMYEKKGTSNTRNVKKVILTQNKQGIITIFKNDADVGFDNYSSYWSIDYFSDYLFEVGDVDVGVNYGGLTSCPQSKTTLKYPNTGGVKFFNDDSGEDRLIDWDFSLTDFLTKTSSGNSAVGIEKEIGLGASCDSILSSDKWLTDFDSTKYSGSCLYQSDTSTSYGCHIIELNLSTSNVQIVDSFQSKMFNYNKFVSYVDYESFVPSHIQNTAESIGCPPVLTVDISKPFVAYDERFIQADISYGKKSGVLYNIVAVRGNNAFTGEKLIYDDKLTLNFNQVSIFEDCADLFNGNENVIDMLASGITLLKIAIPLVLFGLGSLDFLQAIFAGNEDGMKKAKAKFIKRLLIAVCIFLVPSILKLILTIANGVWGNISTDLCGLL